MEAGPVVVKEDGGVAYVGAAVMGVSGLGQTRSRTFAIVLCRYHYLSRDKPTGG